MNLVKLFETQRVLDERIVKEKGLEGVDLLQEKILALLTELGELSNEWRGFKFWSEDRESKTKFKIECSTCVGTGDSNAEANTEMMMEGKDGVPYEACEDCNKTGISGYRNPLLEEYVDCLHFILSIGNDVGVTDVNVVEMGDYTKETTTETFIYLQNDIWDVYKSIKYSAASHRLESHYELLFARFIGLGELQLGFNWKDVEQAYFSKNAINHERQENGY